MFRDQELIRVPYLGKRQHLNLDLVQVPKETQSKELQAQDQEDIKSHQK